MVEYLGNGLGGPFSLKSPYLRLYWDATCLDALMRDPFSYAFEMNGGWRPREPQLPLIFGDLYHRCRQYSEVMRVGGASPSEALEETLRYAHREAHAIGLDAITLENGRVCPECGGAGHIVTQKAEPPQGTGEFYKRGPRKGEEKMTPGKKERTRACTSGYHAGEARSLASLTRALIWHSEQFSIIDPVRPLKGASGATLVEQNFTVSLPFTAPTGERYHLCGYLDGVVEYAGQQMPREMKHTINHFSSAYFANLECSTQFLCYSFISWLFFGKGETFQSELLLDATSLQPKAVEFERKVFYRNRDQHTDFLHNLEYWIKEVAEPAHAKGHHLPSFETFTPWSPSGQSLYTKKDGTGGSAFKRCMAQPPNLREAWLRERFTRSDPWNPTIEREKF